MAWHTASPESKEMSLRNHCRERATPHLVMRLHGAVHVQYLLAGERIVSTDLCSLQVHH